MLLLLLKTLAKAFDLAELQMFLTAHSLSLSYLRQDFK